MDLVEEREMRNVPPSRALMLRWHPDKFLQRFGHQMHTEERDEILRRVGLVFHAVRDKW